MNAKETADSVTSLHGDALPLELRWIQTHADTVNARSERLSKTLVLVVCGWSLIEAPLELGITDVHAGILALLVSKLAVVGIGLAAVAKARFAPETFAFLCGASVLAIAPALPTEFNQSFAIAIISTVECFSKATCFMVLGVALSREQLRQP